jgi:hypothetical protein
VQWEYAVLWVRIKRVTSQSWTFEAKAWVDENEIYSEEFTDLYWTKPLAALGRDGWELVSVTTENALMGSRVTGWATDTSRPIQTNFILKRPVVG